MLVQPFDFKPIRTEVKTGAYQIPVGEYALVTPASSLFSLDGNEVFLSTTINQSGTVQSDPDWQDAILWPVGGGFYFDFTFRVTNSGFNPLFRAVRSSNVNLYDPLVNGNNGQWIDSEDSGQSQPPPSVGAIGTLNIVGEAAGDSFVRGLILGNVTQTEWSSTLKLYRKPNQSFWVPSETNLDGTNYTVQIYKVAT